MSGWFSCRCTDDIDLYPGIMSERRGCDEILGPTQKCLIGLQFKALKEGDRFWYEREDPTVGFTLGKLLPAKQKQPLYSMTVIQTSSKKKKTYTLYCKNEYLITE